MGITASNLTKVYGTQTAVDDVSFEMNTGEVLGFLGPNGAGKTTTMRILTCYLSPTAGTATLAPPTTLVVPRRNVRRPMVRLIAHPHSADSESAPPCFCGTYCHIFVVPEKRHATAVEV